MDYNTDRRSVKEESRPETTEKSHSKNNEQIPLDVGAITIEQINLIFKYLPFDLTYVDENNKVRFYNRGEERIFPRSPGVIGRDVKFCHPPKSLDTVLKIVTEFKEGSKDVAEFWFTIGKKFLYIRYFAVRNQEGIYKGVLEVSQEISDIKTLEGEQKLLDWE